MYRPTIKSCDQGCSSLALKNTVKTVISPAVAATVDIFRELLLGAWTWIGTVS